MQEYLLGDIFHQFNRKPSNIHKGTPLRNLWFCSLHENLDRPIMPEMCYLDFQTFCLSVSKSSFSPMKILIEFFNFSTNIDTILLENCRFFPCLKILIVWGFKKCLQHWIVFIFELIFLGNYKFDLFYQVLNHNFSAFRGVFSWKTLRSVFCVRVLIVSKGRKKWFWLTSLNKMFSLSN